MREHQVRNDPYIMRDPTAELSPVVRERLPPPASLEGRTVSLLSISKERSDEFLSTLAHCLTSRGITVARFEKPTHTKPAPEHVVLGPEGQLKGYVAGTPFAMDGIDCATDPDAGVKLAWNFAHRWRGDGGRGSLRVSSDNR